MALAVEKTMFEIYREVGYGDRYRVVYFTELNEYNKDAEINRAMAGEPYFDGYLRSFRMEEAKRIIDSLLDRLNAGDPLDRAEVRAMLAECLAEG